MEENISIFLKQNCYVNIFVKKYGLANLGGDLIMKIKANGIQINYELSGKEGSPVVILSHSLASSLIMWEPQLKALEPHFKVLRYDIRGHGESDVTKGPYTLELLSDDVVGLLDNLGIDRVHWVGLSLGGMIGQSFALNHPDRLISLVLCDTTARIPEEAQPLWEERIKTASEKGLSALLDETMERWFSSSFIEKNPPILSTIRKQFLLTPLESYLGCVYAVRKIDYLDQLSKIKIPTLIMVGENDIGTPISASEAIHERIENSKLVIIRSAKHLSNVEKPEEFNSTLLAFLKEVK